MIKTVLVAGGAGFIGSHTVLELLVADFKVIVIDNFINSVADDAGMAVSLTRVQQLTGKSVIFRQVDLVDKKQLEEIFNEFQFQGVIHLAALKCVPESLIKPLEYYSNNIIGSINLINLCKQYNVKNFIFSSSATVYGPPQTLPLTEEHPTGQGITNPYGQTKYFIEQILIDLAKAEPDWNIVLLRYFNPVAAHPSGEIGEDPKGIPNNLMPYVSQVAIGKLPYLHVFGHEYETKDGTGVRDFIHIVDLAKGHVSALKKIEKDKQIGLKVYNLGTGNGYSVLEMVHALEKTSGKTIKYELEDPRPGDVASVYCDPKLAADEMDWRADLGLADMSTDLWNWQSKNPNGYQSTK